MNRAYVLMGGNIGNRQANLREAMQRMEARCGRIVRRSSCYETAAWGQPEQPHFLNQCVLLETPCDGETLMACLLEIEKDMGRVRTEKMGPRTIDLDILFFNEEVKSTPLLVVPHPRLHLRRFALMPLAEIAGTLVHPVMGKTVDRLLEECTDTLDVYKI